MKILISPEAKIELKESVRFYEARQKGLGKKLTDSVRNKLTFIASNPLSSEIKYDDVHVTFLKGFPFSIHYLYEKEKHTILVAAIFHTSRNPKKN